MNVGFITLDLSILNKIPVKDRSSEPYILEITEDHDIRDINMGQKGTVRGPSWGPCLWSSVGILQLRYVNKELRR